jgi:site-specific DNA-methyltransferase (adenine-specific)
VTDGPYGISHFGHSYDTFDPKKIKKGIKRKDGQISPSMFSGKYDTTRSGSVKFQQFSYEWAVELLRILKPGAHLLSFCSPRMYHRMATGIEDAGFEIRDQLQFLFGTGQPKSHDISKAIDKLAGAKRKIVGENTNRKGRKNWDNNPKNITLPATNEAEYWDGYGTHLKPSNEPILLARKPIAQKSVARNVLAYGTGAINIDACRIETEDEYLADQSGGRFPCNTIIDHEVAELLGGKAKFFYGSKASQKEKNAGCNNHHPTVKNIALMEYLVKLVTPKNGICLDLFMGSGSTGIACSNLGFGFIGIERESEYYEIAKARIDHWQNVRKVA